MPGWSSRRRASRRRACPLPADVAKRKECSTHHHRREGTGRVHGPPLTPTAGVNLRIRVFYQWMHELDIRDAVGSPGGDDWPRPVLPRQLAGAMGYLVVKEGGRPACSRVRVYLTGPAAARSCRGGRSGCPVRRRAVGCADGTVTHAPSASFFARLRRCARSADLRNQVTLDGAESWGKRLIANMG